MKKILVSCFVLLTFFSCKEKTNEQIQSATFNAVTSTDELFSMKDKISKNEEVKFINRFYIINFTDSISSNIKNIEKEKLVEFLLTKYPFGEISSEDGSKIATILRESKTKKEFIEKFQPCNFTDQGIMQDFRQLTEDVFVLDISGCDAGPSEYLLTYEDGKIVLYNEEKLESLENSSKKMLENKLNKKFSQQFGKPVSYSKATINGKDFFTFGFYEVVNEDSANAYQYNAMVAVSKTSKEMYYIYDNSELKNDDWNNENLEFEQIEVPKNANWIKLN